MKKINLTYKGFTGGAYLFCDVNGVEFKFARVNNALIDEFGLKEKHSIGQAYLVQYFIVEDKDKDIFILSDLAIVKDKAV